MAITIQDFEMAVHYAFTLAGVSPSDSDSLRLRDQANTYCTQVRAQPDGWKWHLQLFTVTTREQAKFFSLQYLIDLLHSYPAHRCSVEIMGVGERLFTRQVLFEWLAGRGPALAEERVYVKNKIALMLALLIKHDYPERWPGAFSDLISLGQLGGSFSGVLVIML